MKYTIRSLDESGFSLIEIVIACVILPVLVISLSGAYNSVKRSYTISRELNEIYSVLSACPEIDRALEYDSVTGATNCFPNNSFLAEGGSSTIITYNPTLSITNTADLPNGDPLKAIPDSKVINVKVGYQKSTTQPFELRMLITRNGIGQQ